MHITADRLPINSARLDFPFGAIMAPGPLWDTVTPAPEHMRFQAASSTSALTAFCMALYSDTPLLPSCVGITILLPFLFHHHPS